VAGGGAAAAGGSDAVESGSNTGVYIGAVAGVVGGAVAIAAVAFFLKRRPVVPDDGGTKEFMETEDLNDVEFVEDTYGYESGAVHEYENPLEMFSGADGGASLTGAMESAVIPDD
jgi:hypothetical protein